MRILAIVFLCALFFADNSFAKGDGILHHGGVGFMFEDVNSFANPSHRASTKGAAIQLDYNHINNENLQSLTPSFVWGSGKFGFGFFASRLGTSLTDPLKSTDSIGGDIGLAFANDRVGFGVSHVRSIDVGQDSDGTFTAALRVSGQNGHGFNVSVAGNTTVNRADRDIKGGVAGMGYAFATGAIEASYAVTDFKDPKENFKALAALNLEGKTVYFSGGFGYEKPTNASIAAGRFGIKYKKIDFSGHIDYVLAKGSTPAYGGTFRLMF